VALKPTVDIVTATREYETWLSSRIAIVRADLREKHQRMCESPFVFLRATFYWWIQRWQSLGHPLDDAPRSLAVGDLHVENFGTWRDAEGRLIWGINDFDEACELPYTHDLIRLATSACLAEQDSQFSLSDRSICEAILEATATVCGAADVRSSWRNATDGCATSRSATCATPASSGTSS
jgi:uncharacterized protein (DUF2252 family)